MQAPRWCGFFNPYFSHRLISKFAGNYPELFIIKYHCCIVFLPEAILFGLNQKVFKKFEAAFALSIYPS